MIRNVILDWSGTVVNDLPAVLQATNGVFRLAGIAEISLERFRAEFCLPFQSFYDRFTPHVPMPQLEQWFHAEFREAGGSVCLLPHAREFLEFAIASGKRLFVLSTVHPDHFWPQARALDLERYIEKAYLGVLDKRTKIRELIAENELACGETVFVGDMQHDIETAKFGGVHSCAVLTGYNSLDQLRAAEPDRIVEHLGELKRLIDLDPFGGGEARELRRRPVVTVGALVFDAAGRVLMLQTHKWSDLWGIPGGKIEFGESSEEALRRELLEETGLDVAEIEFVLVQDCIQSKEFYREEHFVLLNYRCRCTGGEVRLNSEAQRFAWVRVDEALRLPLNRPTRVLLERIQTPVRQ